MALQAALLLRIRHPNIVLVMGICLEPLMLITEWFPRGSLADCLGRARKVPSFAAALNWPRRLSMALDAAKVPSLQTIVHRLIALVLCWLVHLLVPVPYAAEVARLQ